MEENDKSCFKTKRKVLEKDSMGHRLLNKRKMKKSLLRVQMIFI